MDDAFTILALEGTPKGKWVKTKCGWERWGKDRAPLLTLVTIIIDSVPPISEVRAYQEIIQNRSNKIEVVMKTRRTTESEH